MPNIDSILNQMKDSKELADLLWKARQRLKEGYDAPFAVASIYWDPRVPCYRVSVPYNAEFVSEFKTQTGPAFDEATKTWVIAEGQYLPALRLILHHFQSKIGQIMVRGHYEAELAASQNRQPALSKEQIAAFDFVCHLDSESLAAAFKKRATTLHPDKGGSSADFAEFNAAYQLLKEEMSK